MRQAVIVLLTLAAATVVISCGQAERSSQTALSDQSVTGAWRTKVQFQSGPFATVKDLEFMYVFNAGGTMTESSNYDAAPPVPPAYGIWKQINKSQFAVRYEFYMTRVPDSSEHLPISSGWLPAGRGVLVDTITLADDGQSFSSRTHFTAFDQSGKIVRDGGGDATGNGSRMTF